MLSCHINNILLTQVISFNMSVFLYFFLQIDRRDVLLEHPHVMGMSFCSCKVSSVLFLLGHTHVMGMSFCFCRVSLVFLLFFLQLFPGFSCTTFFSLKVSSPKLAGMYRGSVPMFHMNDFWF